MAIFIVSVLIFITLSAIYLASNSQPGENCPRCDFDKTYTTDQGTCCPNCGLFW